MTKRTKYVGYQESGKGSDKMLSPRRPYTGDGKTRRTIFDRVSVIFKKATDK